MIIFDILSYITDMLLAFVYLNRTFHTRRANIPTPLFYAAFVLAESVLMANQLLFHNPDKQFSVFVTISLSILSTFALCFLYETTLRRKVIYSIIFQFFATFSEATFILIIKLTSPDMLKHETPYLVTIAGFGSKIILFLFILIFTMFSKDGEKSDFEYHIFSLVTPVISLILLIAMPAQNFYSNKISFYNIIILPCILILNITNYFILERIKYTHKLVLKNTQLEQQINFQKNKYSQLSTTYRNTRRVVHDTKKHHFTILKYIEEKRYDELNTYVKASYEDLENTYSLFNTGNLVIDSLLSNYSNLAKENSIVFSTSLNLEAVRIPIEDYDLCIILGNLLDNCINACKKLAVSDRWIKLSIYIDAYDKFRIDCCNSTKNLPKKIKPDTSLEHGFGTTNVDQTVKKNRGMMISDMTDDQYTTIISIPILDLKQKSNSQKKC